MELSNQPAGLLPVTVWNIKKMLNCVWRKEVARPSSMLGLQVIIKGALLLPGTQKLGDHPVPRSSHYSSTLYSSWTQNAKNKL